MASHTAPLDRRYACFSPHSTITCVSSVVLCQPTPSASSALAGSGMMASHTAPLDRQEVCLLPTVRHNAYLCLPLIKSVYAPISRCTRAPNTAYMSSIADLKNALLDLNK